MSHLTRFHCKYILKSSFFKVSYLLTLLLFAAFIFALNIKQIQHVNYIIRFDSLAYIEIVLEIILFCLAAFFASQKKVLELTCLYSRAQVEMSMAISTILCSLLLCLIPVAYVLGASIIEKTEFQFTLLAIIYVIMRWWAIIIATESLAFFLSAFFNNNFIYILSLPAAVLLSYLNEYILSWLFFENAGMLSNLFSLQKPFIFGLDMDYPGPRVDLFMVSKFLCVLLFSSLAFCLIWLIYTKKNRFIAFALVLFLLAAEIVSILFWIKLYPENYTYDGKLYISDYAPQNWRVSYYDGAIRLSENTSVECKLGIVPASNADEMLTMRLDSGFTINEIKVNDTPCSFSREENYIKLQMPANSAEEEIVLSFSYSGRISYLSDISSINIYTSWFSSALPANFAFLPIIDGDTGEKEYSLEVAARNTVISNLPVTNTEPNKYVLHGNASTCCLFMGYFSCETKNGITLFHAKYNNLTDYWGELDKFSERRWLDPYTYELYDGQGKLPNKVFVIYYLYGVLGFPVVFDDYVMINYGYPSAR